MIFKNIWWGMYPPRSSLLGLRPAVSFATPSWVRPGTGICKLHTPVGRTRGESLIESHTYTDGCCKAFMAVEYVL